MRIQTLGIHGCAAALGVCMLACARDGVSLGDDIYEPMPPSIRCARDPLIDADVRVTNQAELDALAGCEEISGDLEIAVYPDTDLRPLAALRTVGGALDIGIPLRCSPPNPSPSAATTRGTMLSSRPWRARRSTSSRHMPWSQTLAMVRRCTILVALQEVARRGAAAGSEVGATARVARSVRVGFAAIADEGNGTVAFERHRRRAR